MQSVNSFFKRGMMWYSMGAVLASAALYLSQEPPRTPEAARPAAVAAILPGLYVPGMMLARFVDGGLDRARVSRDLGAAVTETMNTDTHDVTIRFSPTIPVERAVAALQADPGVVFAEPDGIYTADYTPDDPYYDKNYDSSDGRLSQWFLRTIDGPKAWDVLKPVRSKIRVGIIDTGVDYTHPDLKAVIARDSKGEVVGKSFVPGINDPLDDHGHGTHCAGIAAAETDNSVGVAGVGFHSFEIVPAKVLGAEGGGEWDWIANAITWCADNGCRVESMSLGGSMYSQGLQDAINYAWQKGVIVVAAAGNSRTSNHHYPAACNHVMAVSATDSNDKLAIFSNYGNPIAVGAPGVRILATMPTYPCAMTRQGRKMNYDSLSGTSMACPVVAGTLGALLAYQPSLTATEAIQRVEATADNTAHAADGGWEIQFGNGRVNLNNAIRDARRRASVGSFYGQVVDSDGRSLLNCTVRCGENSFITGVDGIFRMANLKKGSYSITATGPAGSGQVTANIEPGADTNLVITLKKG